MTNEEDVIKQADTMIRRYRSFVARPTQHQSDLDRQRAAHADEDIPVLTEVVDAQAITSQHVDRILDALRVDIEAEVSAWVVDVLPAAVANASQQILDELDAKARTALLSRLQALLEVRRSVPE